MTNELSSVKLASSYVAFLAAPIKAFGGNAASVLQYEMEPQPNAPPLYPDMQASFMPSGKSADKYLTIVPTAPGKDLGPVLAQPQPQPVIVLQSNAQPQLGHVSQRLVCPHCNTTVMTRLEHRVTKRTHAFSFALCITGLICLVPLPYCMDTCKSLDHYCSYCNQFIGKSVS
ncbi:lipopolysaccharide-induced tumor necrosis factor-alpha factor homolog [Scaptodrosophila lebanonensis]|uniref:Lipopolysaccharide-induced tumor necrosis factor-alpha factor homolog n=1 Tax=Drosophila lebanonensis TaxID=7225 RepID=A0A6J2UK01_DROLE|nr:lipopolysaccharide-induced tumor necrosis factor-alpha factor homolog [Scaptodrosophila lebanonensis]